MYLLSFKLRLKCSIEDALNKIFVVTEKVVFDFGLLIGIRYLGS